MSTKQPTQLDQATLATLMRRVMARPDHPYNPIYVEVDRGDLTIDGTLEVSEEEEILLRAVMKGER